MDMAILEVYFHLYYFDDYAIQWIKFKYNRYDLDSL